MLCFIDCGEGEISDSFFASSRTGISAFEFS